MSLILAPPPTARQCHHFPNHAERSSYRGAWSMVMKQAAWLATKGGVIGLVLAGVIGTLAQSLLVGVPAIDPLAFGGTAALFAVILAAACWTPARRAAATDPATALRAE